ncbi:peptidase M3A/M3B [Immersiella caudata]|uniref:Peptidase M3A/M3B n=1 Tax=Immersiella caudata TaxID=314043 RepID=A0AA40BZI6_9PEZI|nr:peptidase M3A/M3B [Immersiella caudata]
MSPLSSLQPRPTLLRHNEMRTMFHGLGHCIHHLVAETKYDLRFSRDFVEIPSLLLEHWVWVWVPQVLKKLGRHYLDGTEISDKMIDGLIKIKTLNDAHAMLAQVHLAMFDLAIHSPESHEAAKGMHLTRLWTKIKKDIVGLSLGDKADEGHGQASFPHIFMAYDARYFAHPTSKIYASDIYSTFFAEDPMSPEAGRRYWWTALELGASIPEWDLLKAYMGRDLNGDAFYSELSASD